MKTRFESLPKSDQEAILDKHRDRDIQDDWWDCVYDNFKTDMDAIGITVDQMYFSGFWSQGDGACFEGQVSDWPKFLTSIDAHSRWMHKDIYGELIFNCAHYGYYYHCNCVRFIREFEAYNPYGENTIRFHAMEALLEECSNEAEDLFEQCEEAFKGHMRDLYNSLEKEHDYLTSDEYVLERLIETDELEEAINEHLEGTEESAEENMDEV